MENSMAGGFGWLVHKARNSSMSGRLTTEGHQKRLQAERLSSERSRNDSIEIRQKITPPPPVGINPVKPYDIKYADPLGWNALLHVYVERIGIQSSEKVRPQPYLHVFIACSSPAKAADGCTYSERSSYGEGYRKRYTSFIRRTLPTNGRMRMTYSGV
ncbi:MAG: hypothetical protein IPL05_07590 [Betaproteobacteria bacterium]|nr:hypothetical protein [Betaproteobacteria bacterium]